VAQPKKPNVVIEMVGRLLGQLRDLEDAVQELTAEAKDNRDRQAKHEEKVDSYGARLADHGERIGKIETKVESLTELFESQMDEFSGYKKMTNEQLNYVIPTLGKMRVVLDDLEARNAAEVHLTRIRSVRTRVRKCQTRAENALANRV